MRKPDIHSPYDPPLGRRAFGPGDLILAAALLGFVLMMIWNLAFA